MSHFYPPYVPPQSTAPPQRKSIALPPDITGDYVIPNDRILLYPLPDLSIYWRIRASRVAPLIPLGPGAADFPLKLDRITPLIAFISRRAKEESSYLPPRVRNLAPPLIPNPEDTIPLPRTLKLTQSILEYFIPAFKLPPRSRTIRREIALPTVSFITRIAFQPDAFQTIYPGSFTAFQGFNQALRIRRDSLIVVPYLLVVPYIDEGLAMVTKRAGSAIVISCRIYDPTAIPNLLIDPDSVLLSLINPNQTPLISLTPMGRVSVGNFSYIHQSLSTDQLGAYNLTILSSIGSNIDITQEQVAFVLAQK